MAVLRVAGPSTGRRTSVPALVAESRNMGKNRRLSQLCETLNRQGLSTELDGEDREIHAVNTLEEAGKGEIAFLSNPKYQSALAGTRACAVIVRPGVDVPAGVSALRCADPYAAVTVAMITLHGHRQHPQWGISDRATIDPSARIGANADIAAYVTVSAGASIGDNCTIYPGCYIADNASLGNDCVLFPNVVVYDGCVIGSRVTIHAGSVIGEDGLGYAPYEGKWIKIPQVGRTVIEDDVEIGANCAIDRATLGETRIGAGTKFGNVVVIGHAAKVGSDCLFVGQVGIAGSAKIGRHVTLAGQVGVAGHLQIGDDVTAAAQSGIHTSIEANSTVFGSPAMAAGDAKRSAMAVRKLPAWIQRIKELEREVRALREKVDANGEG